MITEGYGLENIDYGLTVTFNGSKYTFLGDGIVKDYPIGGLSCEYFDLVPTKIKDIILSCSNLDAAPTVDIISDTMLEFHQKCIEQLLPVQAVMISVEFYDSLTDWFKAIRENRVEEYIDLANVQKKNPEIGKFIFADTPFDNVGCNTVLQLLLSAYAAFADCYTFTKYMFMNALVSEDINEENEKVIDALTGMYSTCINMQHIDFRIISTEKGLENMYTIRSSISLLVFEHANSYNAGVNFVKCANCGRIFIPEGRVDTIYCSHPSPQNSERTCKEIGAQVARANKEKNDVTTHEYRKVYMRYKMMLNRNPGKRDIRKKFDKLTTEIKKWRAHLNDGSATTEQFLEWLSQF